VQGAGSSDRGTERKSLYGIAFVWPKRDTWLVTVLFYAVNHWQGLPAPYQISCCTPKKKFSENYLV